MLTDANPNPVEPATVVRAQPASFAKTASFAVRQDTPKHAATRDTVAWSARSRSSQWPTATRQNSSRRQNPVR